MDLVKWVRQHRGDLLFVALCIMGLSMTWRSVAANDKFPTRGKVEALPCPEDLLPPLYPVGPLCVPACTKVQEFGNYIALTAWDTALAEGPSEGLYFLHIFVSEGWWEIEELFAMNHYGPSEEIKLILHDGLEWHGLAGVEQSITYDEDFHILTITPVPQYQGAYFNSEGIIIGPGMEIGAVWRLGEWNPWDKFPRDLRFNLTLRRVENQVAPLLKYDMDRVYE